MQMSSLALFQYSCRLSYEFVEELQYWRKKQFDRLQISSKLNDGNGDVEAGKKINNAHSSSDNNNYVDDNENNDKLELETDLRGVRTDAQKNGKASLR